MIETTFPEMKKQIATIGKAVAKLETMSIAYPRWNGNCLLTRDGKYAAEQIEDIKHILQSLEMALI